MEEQAGKKRVDLILSMLLPLQASSGDSSLVSLITLEEVSENRRRKNKQESGISMN